MLMLEHKGIPYERVELLTGAHPLLVRLRGFPGHRKPIREVDGGANAALTLFDRMGTVPALAFGAERVQTNRAIARFLDRVQPDPPLFPAEPALRARVEEAEAWGDEVLQMAARRITLAAGRGGLDGLHARGGDGRLGALLSRDDRMRFVAGNVAARIVFGASSENEEALLAQVPSMLDRVDAWIGEGVLGGPVLNAADYMIAPSLALMTYRRDVAEQILSRPAGAFVDRILPLPAATAARA
jgi:glutathione S-transferase